MNFPMNRDPRAAMMAMAAQQRGGGMGMPGMGRPNPMGMGMGGGRPSVAGWGGGYGGGYGGAMAPPPATAYGYALPGYGGGYGGMSPLAAAASAACAPNPDGSLPPGCGAPYQPLPGGGPGGCLPICPQPALAALAPSCPPVFYPLNTPCADDGLTLAPINPCDPFSWFCSLFGQRRGLQPMEVGIPATPVPAQSSVTIPIPVGFYFIPCTLRIPSDIINAGLFVANLTSGGNPEFGSSTPIPARLFSEVAVDRITLQGNPAGILGQGLSITVINQTNSPIVFSGAIKGVGFVC